MVPSLRSGPSSSRVEIWLEHDNRRTALSHAAPDWFIPEEDVLPMVGVVLVIAVNGHELRNEVDIPEGAPAGTRCRTVARATAAA